MRIGTDRDGRSVYFVHVPRTAGTSILRWLGGDWQSLPHEHKPIAQLRGLDFEARGLGIIRNPFDRVVSQFHHDNPRGSISEFREWLPKAKILDHSLWSARWILEGCDTVVRFEALPDEMTRFLKTNGIPPPEDPFPHENASTRRPTRRYYDTRAASHVHALCAWEIQRYGYQMPEVE